MPIAGVCACEDGDVYKRQGTIELDGEDISRLSEPKRAKYLGRVFQDPMRGTAADMQIEENLALATVSYTHPDVYKRQNKTRGS